MAQLQGRNNFFVIEDSEEWWEEAILRHPLFQKRIAQARQSAQEGKGVSIE